MLCSSAYGLGLAPASKNIIFTPGGKESVLYRVYNTENTAYTAEISINGSLSQYATLSEKKLVFKQSDGFKEFNVTLAEPEAMGPGLSADIIVKGHGIIVKSRLGLENGGMMPTGSVIKESGNVDNSGAVRYVLPGALILVVIANILYFASGKLKTVKARRIKHPASAEDILAFLRKINMEKFREFVTPERNDIADWIEKKDPALAFKLYDIRDRREMIKAIEAHLAKKGQEKEKSPAELKDEIAELKKELDTFDFNGFEKDL